MAETQRMRDLEALNALCQELARLGLLVEIRDARPAVSARSGASGTRVWVTVNPSGQLFTWRREGRDQHGVDDPKGAAAGILAYIEGWEG
jgi:hypothetical protein